MYYIIAPRYLFFLLLDQSVHNYGILRSELMIIFMYFCSYIEESYVTLNGLFTSSKDSLNFLGFSIVCLTQKKEMLQDKSLKGLENPLRMTPNPRYRKTPLHQRPHETTRVSRIHKFIKPNNLRGLDPN